MYWGVVLTSLLLGVRHGFDWDHVAAIADLNSSARDRRHGLALSMIYALAHALVVFLLGATLLLVGATIPDSVDEWMTRVVGVTLIALGAWIIVELTRQGRNFTLRSRWMLIIDGTFAGLRRVRAGLGDRKISVEHDHEHTHVDDAHEVAHAHDHTHSAAAMRPVEVVLGPANAPSPAHRHRHRHVLALPNAATAGYGGRTAAGVGMLHGVGVESPTQIAIFVASTAVAGTGFGLVLLGTWVVGLVIANAVLAIVAGAGLLNAERNYPIYVGLALFVAMASIVLGASYVAGFDIVPAG